MSGDDDKKPGPPEDSEESTVFSPGAMPGRSKPRNSLAICA